MFSSAYWSCESAGPELAKQLSNSMRQLQRARLRRARGFYLYFDRLAGHDLPGHRLPGQSKLRKSGQVSRILDLYLDAGQALSGYRSSAATARLKNLMSRGLYAALPSERGAARARILLQRLFPDLQDFRLLHNLQSIDRIQANFSLAQLLRQGQSDKISLWRPLAATRPSPKSGVGANEGERELAAQGLIVPVLGLSSLALPYLLISFDKQNKLPPSDICSPLQMEALIQALAQTLSLQEPGKTAFDCPALAELRRRAAQSGKWHQDGIYLYWKGGPQSEPDYLALWQQGFVQGFLFPPNPWAPVILNSALLQKDSPSNLNKDGQALRQLLL